MTPLSPRFRDTPIRRFTAVIKNLSAAYPDPITFDPAPLTSEVFRCAFRDAVRAITQKSQCPDLLPYVVVFSNDYKIASSGEGKLSIGSTENLTGMMRIL